MQTWNKSFLSKWSSKTIQQAIIWIFGGLTIVASVLSIRYNMLLLQVAPAAIIVAAIAIFDYRKLFFLLCASIPLSVEIYLPGGLATDLPTEPLMWVLMGVSLLSFLLHLPQLNTRPLTHPLSLVLYAHIGWLIVTTVTSQNHLFSIKILLAKIWYVTVFYFLAIKIFRTENDIKKIIYPTFLTLTLVILVCLTRHAMIGFSFSEVNSIVGPFFQNHVLYAALPATFLPFAWYALDWHTKWSWQWWILVFGLLILILGVQFSYTRTAYVAIFMAMGAYYIIRWRIMKWILIVAVAFTTYGGYYFVQQSRYLGFAPDFSKTISHQSFDNLLDATYKMQDISTMERVYRWVAAGHMIAQRPLMGFGAGTFYSFYKNYTVSSFRTYVSDNAERSTTHCYFLMVWVEQGIFGLIFFLLFNFGALLLGERVYHQAKDAHTRRIALMATLSLIIIDGILIINDMIETDKIGTVFFLCAALLVRLDLQNQDHLREKTLS